MTSSDGEARGWRIGRNRWLSLESPVIVGILNVTPDSFSDGGEHASPRDAVNAALKMIEDGAAVIDVGGESTRPGAARVSIEEQINRTAPVIEAIRAASDVVISIDTTKGEVAEAAIDVGATIINDVAAGVEDERIFALAAQRDCGLILMHRLAPPDADSYSDKYATPPVYDDVVATVAAFLVERAEAAMRAGVKREAIAIDPGLGFGKTVAQNFELIARTDELVATGFPVLCGASRKSFIGKAANVADPRARLAGSVAAALAMHAAGARVFRVHDVKPHREALAVAETIRHSRELVEREPKNPARTPI